jgi:hypothetical protein
MPEMAPELIDEVILGGPGVVTLHARAAIEVGLADVAGASGNRHCASVYDVRRRGGASVWPQGARAVA